MGRVGVALLFCFAVVFGFGAAQDSLECIFCETAADYFLLNPNGTQEIDQLLEEFCSLLPNSTQGSCIKGVKSLEVFINNIPIWLSRKEQFTGFAVCTMVNICELDCCISDSPEQVHISYLEDPHTQLSFTWVTRKPVESIVQYGTSLHSLTSSQTGTIKTYTPGYWHGWIHNVAIKNLAPGTTYYYRVGGASGWSNIFTFRTEDVGSNARTIRVANIGDMGLNNSAGNIAALKDLVSKNQLDFLIHNGDISYADGFQQRWDMYFREVEDIVANLPYMVTLGNHEISVFPLLNLTVGYPYRFALPGAGSGSLDYSNLFYSYNYGLVHFISLDTESIYDIAEMTKKQVAWVIQDLANLDRSKYPWVVVYGHRPFYCADTGNDCAEMAEILRSSLEDVLYKYKVDVVFGAHRHNYQRLYPIYQGNIVKSYDNPGMPVHVINGAGGNREGVANSLQNPIPAFLANYQPKWGYGILTVYNATTLDYDFYDSDTNQVLDHFTLTH